MDFGLVTIGFFVGLAIRWIWKAIIAGQKEGNRQDYTTKIGLLKKQVIDLEQKNTRLEKYLELSEAQCKDRMETIIEQSDQLQKKEETNLRLKKELNELRAGLKIYRKAAMI